MEDLKNVQQPVRRVLVHPNKCKSVTFLYEINYFILADDSRATDAIRAACKEVGSISDIIFEMRFNPNVFSPGVQSINAFIEIITQIWANLKADRASFVSCLGICFPPSESAMTDLQERLLREAAAFIITHQIPAFVRGSVLIASCHRCACQHGCSSLDVCVYLQLQGCQQSNEAPIEGASLKQVLHLKGINLRYLGHVAKAISHSEHKERLRHIMVWVLFSKIKNKKTQNATAFDLVFFVFNRD